MSNPRTVYELLQLLEKYHADRLSTYAGLASQATDTMAQILLEHLVELEDHSLKVVRGEMQQLDPKQTTFLTSGPVLSDEATHASDCHCDDNPTFQEALACALESDHLLDQLLHRLEGCSAAASVLSLAKRLRDLEETKNRQIANFTRQD
ncbi:MAG: hypothetical protein R3C09_13560 [Pirellulaceae bacterium]